MSVALKVSNGTNVLQVVSYYTPTFAASREEKDSFYSMLQEVLSSVPSQECCVAWGLQHSCGLRREDDQRV